MEHNMSSFLSSLVLYMSSSFWLLQVESHDFSQAEKERTACKAEQIHKMTTFFTQKDNLGSFWVIVLYSIHLSFCGFGSFYYHDQS